MLSSRPLRKPLRSLRLRKISTAKDAKFHAKGAKKINFCLNYSAVVGSMIVLISEILFAGKPPRVACSRTISSSGAI